METFNVSPFANFEFINNLYSIKTKNRRSSLEQVVAFGLNRDFDYNEIKDFYIDENGYQRFLGDYTLPLPPIVTTLSSTLWDQEHNSDIDAKSQYYIHQGNVKIFKSHIFLGQASLDYTNTDILLKIRLYDCCHSSLVEKYQWRKKNSTVQNYQALVNYDKSFLQDDLRILLL